MAQIKPPFETFARIKVIGCGGSGMNALQRMIQAKIHGVEFIAVNTDAQDLHSSGAPVKIHIGKSLTRGLGAGMDPEIRRKAAGEKKKEKKRDGIFGGTKSMRLLLSRMTVLFR